MFLRAYTTFYLRPADVLKLVEALVWPKYILKWV